MRRLAIVVMILFGTTTAIALAEDDQHMGDPSDIPTSDVPIDHPINDTGQPGNPPPEYADFAKAYDLSLEETQSIMERQVQQHLALTAVADELGDELLGSSFGSDFPTSGDELTLYVRSEGARDRTLSDLASYGFIEGKTFIEVGQPETDEAPQVEGEEIAASGCNNDGYVEGGRVSATRTDKLPVRECGHLAIL